jgi:hypothetical protein
MTILGRYKQSNCTSLNILYAFVESVKKKRLVLLFKSGLGKKRRRQWKKIIEYLRTKWRLFSLLVWRSFASFSSLHLPVYAQFTITSVDIVFYLHLCKRKYIVNLMDFDCEGISTTNIATLLLSFIVDMTIFVSNKYVSTSNSSIGDSHWVIQMSFPLSVSNIKCISFRTNRRDSMMFFQKQFFVLKDPNCLLIEPFFRRN